MRKLDAAALTLTIVGGLNWGLVAVARFDLVAWICGGLSFGETNWVSRVIYGVVGLSAVYLITRMKALLANDRAQDGSVRSIREWAA
jgi:uncharacterized membrane protein YuzA (DUF378 family)